MKFLILSALALATLALSSSRGQWNLERPLQARTEYRYRYEGSIMTGIPVQNTDVTLTRLRSEVLVQMTDDRTLLLRLKDIRMAASHTEEQSPSRTESLSFRPLEALENRELAREHQRMLEEPVKCIYRNGIISEVQFSSEDEAWSKNIKRAVLNMLQINLDKSERSDEKEKLYNELSEETNQNDFYSVVEKTLEGDCEVAYTIVREQEWTTVTKSINFDKCTGRPDIKYGMRFESDCEDCEKQAELVQPQTVYTYRIEKDAIKTVDVRSIYSVSLKDEPYMKTEIKARLTLEKTQQIGSQIPHPKGSEPKESMVYSNEWEEAVESFFKNGDNSKLEMPFEKYETSKKLQQIRKIVERLLEKDENKPETAHQMARLVRMLRMCSEEELRKAQSEIYKSSDDKARRFFEHALAIAGTHNTVRQLVHLIEKRETTPLKAAQYLKAVQETPYPSERIAEIIVKLAEKSENEPVLRQSAWLCAGTIVRGVVAENRDDQLVNENKREIKQKFIRIFMKEFETAEGVYEKVLALKTLANAGIDLSVFDLQKIIYDKREQLAVRIEAIDALRLLKDEMPRKIQQVLMPIYKNRFEAPELRMAALVKIMHTLPTQPILSQIVFQMERESSQQVAAFTYYMLQTLAKSTSPCHQTISQDISTLLTFTRFQPQENYYSTFLHLPLFSEEFLTGASLNLGALFGRDSYIPKELSASLNTVFGGNWNKYLAQIGFSQQNLDVILEKIVRKLYNMEKESTTVVRGRRVQQSLNLLKELSKKISVKARESNYRQSSEKPHAMLYFRYKEMDFAVLPLDDKVLDEIVEKYIDNGRIEQRQLDRLFNRDHEFEMHHAAFFYEATRKMPTSIGLPLTISGKLPTVFSAEGKLVVEMLPLGVRFHLRIQPSLAATHITQMRFWTPLFEQGVKMLTSVEAQTPVEIKAEVTFKGQFELTYTVAVPEQKKTVIRAHRRPVGFLRFTRENPMDYVEAEEKTLVHPLEEQLTQEVDHTTNVLGMHVQTRGNILRSWTAFENIVFVEQEIELIAESRNRRNEITTRVVIEPVESGRIEKISTSHEKMFEDEFEPEDSEYSIRRNEKERREHFQRHVRDIESGEGYKHRMTVRVEANKEKTAEIEIRTQCDREIRYCRVNFDGRRQPMLQDERNEWTIKGEAHLALPEMPRNLKEMKEQKHREVQAFVEAKWGSEKKSQLSMKMQLEQDKEQNKWLQHAERKEQLSGMNAYEVLVKAGRLNKLNLVAEYELSRQSETVFRRIYDIVKAYGFWSSQWESRQGEEGRVLLQLTVDPISRRYANLTVQTPSELMRMHTVRLPTRMPLVSIARRSIRESFDYTTSNKAECEVKSTRVNTFDDVVYRTPLTTCFSVIAKDCSEEPRFAVLAKKINKNSEELKVRIIDEEGNKIELENKKDEIEIRVNGKVIRKDTELENYGIEKISEDMIRVNLDDVEVRFDGYTVKTHMSRRFQEQQCGLCGHFDGEMDNEFRMANDESTEDIEEFHRSFLVKGEECEIEEERVSEKKNYKNYRRESEYNNYEDESSSEEYDMPERYNEKKYERDNSEYDEDEEIEPVERTRVVEYSHRICFSKEPVMECPRRAKDGKTQEKKMQFICLPRQQSEARRMLREARDGKVLRLSSYPNSYVESIEVPKTCIVY